MRILDLLSVGGVQRLGWMLLHSVWQLAAVALLMLLVLRLMRRRSAELRYLAACGGLALMVLLPLATMLSVETRSTLVVPELTEKRKEAVATAAEPRSVMKNQTSEEIEEEIDDNYSPYASRPLRPRPSLDAPVPFTERVTSSLLPWMPTIVTAWIVGVAGLGLWHLGGWLLLQQLRMSAEELKDAAVLQRFLVLCRRLKIGSRVRLLVSNHIQSPLTFGWWRPVVLVPASVLSGLAPDQLESLLAHELTHVVRHDYLINLLQTAAETLFFYHPALWWMSRQIRIEREYCCDDAAVKACHNATLYASALASLEEARAAAKLSLAATGAAQGDSTLLRVQRILGLSPERAVKGSLRTWLGGAIASVVLLMNLSESAASQYRQRLEFERLAAPLRAYLPDYAAAIQGEDLEHKKELLDLIRPGYQCSYPRPIRAKPGPAKLGASKYGGRPDLPNDLPWPNYKETPMAFMAQINLDELTDMPDRRLLPEHGRLFFFWGMFCGDGDEMPYGNDLNEAGGAVVFYSDAPTNALARRKYPSKLQDEQKVEEWPLKFHVENRTAEWEHPRRLWLDRISDEVRLLEPQWEALEKQATYPDFQILGYPNSMQGPVHNDIQWVFSPKGERRRETERKADEWELLLQLIDCSGDCSLYYMIRKEDLKARRWDKIWFTLQCT